MNHLPGTRIETQDTGCKNLFGAIFLTGGITLSQLSNITGLEAHTVQNWIKRRYATPPINKKYNQDQLCRIIIINMLKEVFSIDEVCSLIDYVNLPNIKGDDNSVSESEIYFHFTEVLFRLNNDISNLGSSINEALKSFDSTPNGERKRLTEVLEIMVSGYLAYSYKQKAALLYRSTIFRGD